MQLVSVGGINHHADANGGCSFITGESEQCCTF